jgi:hypothetical protein
MLLQYGVDLIVVAANCLEARMLKRSLNDIASNAKQNVSMDDGGARGGRMR